MIIKYKTSQWSREAITCIEFERETDKSLFLADGRRVAKDAQYTGYYNSWAEAKAALVAHGVDIVLAAEETVARARRELERFQALIEPPTATKESL